MPVLGLYAYVIYPESILAMKPNLLLCVAAYEQPPNDQSLISFVPVTALRWFLWLNRAFELHNNLLFETNVLNSYYSQLESNKYLINLYFSTP